jgi:DNA (cytosine-5)-methyltransferase 1
MPDTTQCRRRSCTSTTQGGVITVREAARLQSFPDGFVFAGTMNPAFRQIGNAVPPVLAQDIALEINGRF